jgi:hypothetical protein
LAYYPPINKKFISNPTELVGDGGTDHVPSPLRYVVLSAVPLPRLNVGTLSSLENGIILPRTLFNGRGNILMLVAKVANLI